MKLVWSTELFVHLVELLLTTTRAAAAPRLCDGMDNDPRRYGKWDCEIAIPMWRIH